MPTVIIRPAGTDFACEGRQSILDAALAASVALDYGCSSGSCGQCVGRLVEGKIEKIRHHDFPVKDAQRLHGDFLMCSYTAASPEVVIEAEVATDSGDIPWQRIDAKLRKPDWFNDDIAALKVQTPRTSRLRFLPGQNLCLALKDGPSLDLPIASCPCDDRNIEFHLRPDPCDPFCAAIFDAARLPATVRIEGPWGPAPQLSPRQVTLCLAYDIHIAPLRSWIEQQLTDDASQLILLYWVAADDSGFYLENLFKAWSDAFDTFSFETLVSVDPGQLPETLANRLINSLCAPGDNNRILIAGPEPFTIQANALLDRENYPVSSRYVHTKSRP